MDHNTLEQVSNMTQEDMDGFREFLKSKADFIKEIGSDESIPFADILQVMSSMSDEDMKKMIHIGAGFVDALEGVGIERLLNMMTTKEPREDEGLKAIEGWILTAWSKGQWISGFTRYGFSRSDSYFEANKTMTPLRINNQNTTLGEIMNVDNIPATEGVKDIAMYIEDENVLVIEVVNMDLIN